MKDVAFQELLTSIKQAGKIRRGTHKPARVSTFRPADVKAIRRKLKVSQAEFALLRVAARNPRAVAEALYREP